jgi:hypothetical protein
MDIRKKALSIRGRKDRHAANKDCDPASKNDKAEEYKSESQEF